MCCIVSQRRLSLDVDFFQKVILQTCSANEGTSFASMAWRSYSSPHVQMQSTTMFYSSCWITAAVSEIATGQLYVCTVVRRLCKVLWTGAIFAYMFGSRS